MVVLFQRNGNKAWWRGQNPADGSNIIYCLGMSQAEMDALSKEQGEQVVSSRGQLDETETLVSQLGNSLSFT